MASLPVLNSEQVNLLMGFQKSLTQGITNYLNPADPTQQEVIRLVLEISGRTPEKYPNVYKALDSGKPYRGVLTDKVHLVDIGKTKSGKATASVWSTTNEPTMVNGGSILVFDDYGRTLSAFGDNTSVRSGFLSCSTLGETAEEAGRFLDLLYIGFITPDDGETYFVAYAKSAAVSGAPAETDQTSRAVTTEDDEGIIATVTAPVTDSNPQVIIAVGRTGSGPDNADYIYIEEDGMGQNPYLICPFTGNVSLSGTIDLTRINVASDLITNIIIVNSDGSATYLDRDTEYTSDQDMIDAMSVGSAPNILEWDFPYDGMGHGDKGYEDTKSIVYEKGSLTSEEVSYFYFSFTIPFTDGSSSPPFFVCSENSPEESSVNCTTISDLMFWWHCLAEGTLVTLEDGSEVPIEEVNETCRVKTPDGSLAVSATVLGEHDSRSNEHDKVYKLTTENRKTVTATGTHMIAIEDGFSKIKDLQEGDVIITDEGRAKVTSLESIDHSGMFYGLVLGNEEEKNDTNFPTDNAAFYANGILTGDHYTMIHHSGKVHHDLAKMLPNIDRSLHQDYTSALEDKRY